MAAAQLALLVAPGCDGPRTHNTVESRPGRRRGAAAERGGARSAAQGAARSPQSSSFPEAPSSIVHCIPRGDADLVISQAELPNPLRRRTATPCIAHRPSVPTTNRCIVAREGAKAGSAPRGTTRRAGPSQRRRFFGALHHRADDRAGRAAGPAGPWRRGSTGRRRHRQDLNREGGE